MKLRESVHQFDLLTTFRPILRSAVLACLGLLVNTAGGHELSGLGDARTSITTDELRDHLFLLADDTLEGREAGSRGGYAAAKYLVQQLQDRLEPAGEQRQFTQMFSSNYRNLLGVRRGSDDQLKDEYILIGAHYDHVGYGSRRNSRGPIGYVHNGADDNASGIAALLEVLDAISLTAPVTKRSILFAFWDGEEKGLLGSQYWAQHPTVRLEQVRLAINVDMVGHLENDHLEVIGTRSMPGLRKFVSEVNYQNDVAIRFPWKVSTNSDHHTFFSRNIPILMFHTGLHEDYHRPSDDAETIDIDGLGRVARLILNSVVRLANTPDLGQFRVAARHENNESQASFEQTLAPKRPRLGISWRAPQDNAATPGLVIEHVIAGSAADVTGLQSGDRIVTLNDTPLLSSSTLQQATITKETLKLSVFKQAAEAPIEMRIKLHGTPVKIGISWRHDTAEPESVTIVRVIPHSPAHMAGIRNGDRILEFDDHPISSSQQLVNLTQKLTSQATVLVERHGQLYELSLQIH